MTSTGNVTVQTDVVIVGTGFSGLGMSRRLCEMDIDHVVLTKESEVGGTWFLNTYPGLCCDIPIPLYCYRDVPFLDAKRLFPTGPEINRYLINFSYEYGVRDHIRFNSEIDEAHWSDEDHCWHVFTTDGTEYVAPVAISGAGALHIPKHLEIDGIETFHGDVMHTAEWDHSVQLTGKRVAVVGTGASSIQVVPELVGDINVAELKLFQRTPPWVLPIGNPSYKSRGKLKHYAYRLYWYLYQEALGVALTKQTWILPFLQRWGIQNIHRAIKDPVLREKLTPKYPIGGKRIGKSKKYYLAIADSRTTLVTDSINRICPAGIVTIDENGVETLHEVDVIIEGTGFEVVESYRHLRLFGINGEDLVAKMDRVGLKAYKGTMFPGVPNFFILLGPNTGLGHNSVILMIEAQIEWVTKVLRMRDRMKGVDALMPNHDVSEKHNAELQAAFEGTVWTKVKNWYQDPRFGTIPTLWPWLVGKFRKQMKHVRREDFDFIISR